MIAPPVRTPIAWVKEFILDPRESAWSIFSGSSGGIAL
jgi:hypothetical protein